MAFYKEELYDLEYDKNPSEGYITAMINKKNYKVIPLKDVKGIHQAHKGIASLHAHPHHMLNWSSEYPQKEYY